MGMGVAGKYKNIQAQCLAIYQAYEKGLLGDQTMPEDTHPEFANQEDRLAFFTLPMALNYQRNSYQVWGSAKAAYEDAKTRPVFDVAKSAAMGEDGLRPLLTKYKLALQPNKHVNTWYRIAAGIASKWGSIDSLLSACDHDFLKLQQVIQKTHKSDFPYLSGPKIFHYWCHILSEYCDVALTNGQYIQIAPDTHVVKSSVKLGVITVSEAEVMSRDDISERWREVLAGTGINPIDMHSPLWFWSRNGFRFSND
jgi:hypothetical protein